MSALMKEGTMLGRRLGGLAWVAVGRWDSVTITLHARNLALDEIELVRKNVEPYIEGSRALRERWRDHDDLGR